MLLSRTISFIHTCNLTQGVPKSWNKAKMFYKNSRGEWILVRDAELIEDQHMRRPGVVRLWFGNTIPG